MRNYHPDLMLFGKFQRTYCVYLKQDISCTTTTATLLQTTVLLDVEKTSFLKVATYQTCMDLYYTKIKINVWIYARVVVVPASIVLGQPITNTFYNSLATQVYTLFHKNEFPKAVYLSASELNSLGSF
jgi:hypothetical protein